MIKWTLHFDLLGLFMPSEACSQCFLFHSAPKPNSLFVISLLSILSLRIMVSNVLCWYNVSWSFFTQVRIHKTLELADDKFYMITCGKAGFQVSLTNVQFWGNDLTFDIFIRIGTMRRVWWRCSCWGRAGRSSRLSTAGTTLSSEMASSWS